MPQRTINTPREETHQRIADALEDMVDKMVDTSSASNIDYDNTQSGLSATKAQGAIDELAEEKVDKVTGKGLSTNDYTNAEKQKLANIESNAQANVQSDWNEDDTEDDGYIKNKPNLSTSLTATGNPLTIEASESNLVECVAEVEAVQDLHGYDHPWVGGAGKNKFIQIPNEIDDGIKFTPQEDGSIRIHGTNNSGAQITSRLSGNNFNQIYLPIGTYTMSIQNVLPNGCSMDFSGSSGNGMSYGSFASATSLTRNVTDATKPFDYIAFYIQNGVTVDYILKFQIESGSNATTWEPYSNISPITGQTEVVIEDVGKNLLDTSIMIGGRYIGTSGTEQTTGGSDWSCSNYISVIPNTTLTLSGVTNMGSTAKHAFYDSNKSLISTINTTEYTFTIPENAKYLRLSMRTLDYSNIQLELSSTATTYEPYAGKTYTIQLGDTIYGGELDVVTGKLRVNKGIERVDDSWGLGTYGGKNYLVKSISEIYTDWKNPKDPISNMCEFDGYGGASIFNDGKLYQAPSTSGDLYIQDSRYTSKTDFINAYAGCVIVYELATPYTIQLTPQQIRLLKGTNNISCNTGDLSIKYYPDNVLGQLKGDIEDEIDAVANRIKGVKTMQISGGAVSTDGSIMFTNLIGSIIVGTSISNDANSNKCVGIPYSMGSVPALKIMNESTMAVLSNIHISGTLYYIEL